MIMPKITFQGTVTEVRTFRESVFVFVKCDFPNKLKGKVVKFRLTEQNCSAVYEAASVAVGSLVFIEKRWGVPASNIYFSFAVVKDSVVFANTLEAESYD